MDLTRDLKKAVDCDDDTNCCWFAWRVEDLRPFRLQHSWEWPEYWEESWRPEETHCLSDSSEWPPANAGVKSPQWVNNNNNPDGIQLPHLSQKLVLVNKEKKNQSYIWPWMKNKKQANTKTLLENYGIYVTWILTNNNEHTQKEVPMV